MKRRRVRPVGERSDNPVVTVEYKLLNLSDNEIISPTRVTFILGIKEVIPGLEKAVEGKKRGESFKRQLEPQDGWGFGNASKDITFEVPRSSFGSIEPRVGMQLELRRSRGGYQMGVAARDEERTTGAHAYAWVIGVKPDTVKLSFQHPLAGSTLMLEGKVLDVRNPNAREQARISRTLPPVTSLPSSVEIDDFGPFRLLQPLEFEVRKSGTNVEVIWPGYNMKGVDASLPRAVADLKRQLTNLFVQVRATQTWFMRREPAQFEPKTSIRSQDVKRFEALLDSVQDPLA